MADDHVRAYAQALLGVLHAEGVAERVEDELFTAARTIDGDRQLRARLTDPGTPMGARLEVVDELFGGRAHPQTLAALLWIIAAGRARQLSEVAEEVARQGAASREASLAEVRSAVQLDATQRERLADALSSQLGRTVEVQVVVDPEVVGGLVVRIGDTVIDGSIATRLERLRSQMTGAA